MCLETITKSIENKTPARLRITPQEPYKARHNRAAPIGDANTNKPLTQIVTSPVRFLTVCECPSPDGSMTETRPHEGRIPLTPHHNHGVYISHPSDGGYGTHNSILSHPSLYMYKSSTSAQPHKPPSLPPGQWGRPRSASLTHADGVLRGGAVLDVDLVGAADCAADALADTAVLGLVAERVRRTGAAHGVVVRRAGPRRAVSRPAQATRPARARLRVQPVSGRALARGVGVRRARRRLPGVLRTPRAAAATHGHLVRTALQCLHQRQRLTTREMWSEGQTASDWRSQRSYYFRFLQNMLYKREVTDSEGE